MSTAEPRAQKNDGMCCTRTRREIIFVFIPAWFAAEYAIHAAGTFKGERRAPAPYLLFFRRKKRRF